MGTMSPRPTPQQLTVPGTPNQSHAVPPGGPPGPGPGSHPHQHAHHAQQAPPTPTTPATPGGNARLNSQASAFVPSTRASKVVIKDANGRELNVGELRKQPGPEPAAPATPVRDQSKRVSVRMESEEAKRAREEKEREEKERKEREVREAKEKVEREKREKEEAEKRAKEEEERKVREAEEKKKREEEERVRQEEEEKERIRKEKEDEERKVREEEERKIKEEEERKVREETERKEKAEAERLAREQEERQQKEEAEKQAASAAAAVEAAKTKEIDVPAAIEEKEEGEITEDSKPKDKVKETLKINTTLEGPRRRPGPLDLSSAQKPNIPGGLPSALATARIIEDINQVQYPEGILSPKIELNVGAKDGKFRYALVDGIAVDHR
jgi:translation initiation factor 4G